MKVSIITVCKNVENAIERTILSVVTQSCFNGNIEYLIIDGASTDKTAEIIKQYSDKYPIKWISEPDSGIYNAMNKGIKLATGDYLLFLNAGDYLIHYNVIKLLMNLFESNKYDIIYGNALYADPSTGQYHIEAKPNHESFFFYEDALPHQTIFYKKNLFDKFGLYDEKFTILADNVLNKQMVCDGNASIIHLDQIISVFTQDGISSTNNKLNNEERTIFQKLYFSKKEMIEVQRHLLLRKRENQKSIFRLLSKIFMKLHKHWINR